MRCRRRRLFPWMTPPPRWSPRNASSNRCCRPRPRCRGRCKSPKRCRARARSSHPVRSIRRRRQPPSPPPDPFRAAELINGGAKTKERRLVPQSVPAHDRNGETPPACAGRQTGAERVATGGNAAADDRNPPGRAARAGTVPSRRASAAGTAQRRPKRGRPPRYSGVLAPPGQLTAARSSTRDSLQIRAESRVTFCNNC